MTPRKGGVTAKRGVKPPTREKPSVRTGPATPPRSARRPGKRSADDEEIASSARGATTSGSKSGTKKKKAPAKRPARAAAPRPAGPRAVGTPADVETQLHAIEAAGGDGEVELGRGRTLHVSSLDKLFFPEPGVTKGAVMRYYTRLSRFMLPELDGRPLILKRYPDGVDGAMFYQQDAGAHTPDVVRVASVETVEKGRQDRIIGGDLATLLYTVQLGAIEVHPWFSRIDEIDAPDRALIDLDPGEGVPFSLVVELAETIVLIARTCALRVALKTSGSRGIHLVFPLPAQSSYETSARLADLVAQAAVTARPDLATVERSIAARPARSIYVDALQNAHGKSMAAAYSVRATAAATVSAPLRPRELTPRLRLAGLNMATMPGRTDRMGDIWREVVTDRPSPRALARAITVLEGTTPQTTTRVTKRS